MSERKQNPLEEQFRSSQIYKSIGGADTADKIAQGIGKAADTIDTAMNSAANAIRNAAGTPQNNNPNSPNAGRVTPPGVNYNNQYTNRQNPVQSPPPKAPTVQRRSPVKPVPPQKISQPYPPHWNPAMGMNPNQGVKMVREPSKTKFFVTGIVALIAANSMNMLSMSGWIAFAIVVCGTYFISQSLFKGKKKYVPTTEEDKKPKQEKPTQEKTTPIKSTGDPEVDKIIEEGQDYLKKLRKSNDEIPDERMSDCIERIENASSGIFQYIAEKPEKAPQIRKFMNYYLPTTMKLLESYQRLDQQNVKGETISAAMEDIDRMLYTVAGAFEKQLDSLFSEEAMDISTDISVFETMLQQEGFVEEQVKKKSKLN
jgi:5-bromo-4-chloroindolyl phosphate hydrolysis protein